MKKIRIFVPVLLGLMVCSLLLGCGSVTGGGGGGGGGTASSIIYVSTTGSDDAGDGSATNPYQTIQKGLDVVVANGTVSVESGIYVENLIWPSTEGVTLRGASMSTTTLDANNADRGIKIEQAESVKTAKIEKMTITKGHRTAGSGGGIYFYTADTTLSLYEVYIHHCSIEASTSVNGGGVATYLDTTTFEAINCLIKNNSVYHAGGGGGGMIISGTCYISSCEISDNYANGSGAGLFVEGNGGRIENSIIHHNVSDSYQGGGVYSAIIYYPILVIMNCTIASNEANDVTNGKGGGIGSYGGYDTIANCIIYGNTAAAGSPEVWLKSGEPEFSITYSDIKGGYTGTGNVNKDPVFNDPEDDFNLSISSSPVDVYAGGTMEGAPACDITGANRPDSSHSSGCSMGAYECIGPH
jgi:hypothetical protein